MTKTILCLAHVDESGENLSKAACEVLGAAAEFAGKVGAALTVGLIGGEIQAAAGLIADCGATRILGVSGPAFVSPRFASDAAAAEALCRAADAELIFAPATSRFQRALPAVAHRLAGCVDTHVSSLAVADGGVRATRWFYRQRIEGQIQREERPWILLFDGGCHEPWRGAPSTASVEPVAISLPESSLRTKVVGIRLPKTDTQTIRCEAELLFVAGAGWTKKQPDGQIHAEEAGQVILRFLHASGASLGNSTGW